MKLTPLESDEPTNEPSETTSAPRLIVASRVQLKMSKQDAVFVDDADVQIRHQDQHSFVSMRSTNAYVMEFAAVTQRDRSPVVDVVASHSGLGEEWLTIDLGCGLIE